MAQSIGPALRKHWRRLVTLPAGKRLFSRLLGKYVPYTGTLGAVIEVLEPGHCVVMLKERRKLRNHLHSVHAMALDSLGEMATGLALMNGLPDKMRGLLRAECRCEIPSSNQDSELDVSCEIRDTAGDVVSVVTAHWLIGPEKGS